jgi:spore maturation protein CgeB
MRAAYIGILTPGSTSRMRAEWLRRLTPDWAWEWIDTDPPLVSTSRLWQSLAYRFQLGKAVNRINGEVERAVAGKSIDLIWVDKAIFLTPQTMRTIRQASKRLVHFTPDTAFHANRSRNFEKTLRLFDVLVTTKSFEVNEYRKRIDRDTILLATQGFDPEVHYPRIADADRRKDVVFVGLAEPDRQRCLSVLLQNGIPVRLAGLGWDSFVSRWKRNRLFHFEGEFVSGDDYAELLSSSWIGLGLLSKRFPELHTTRTFEIPACGTVLATESNRETTAFFNHDEALFFRDFEDLARQIGDAFSAGNVSLASIAARGRERVTNDHRDYPQILANILGDSRISGVA